MYRFVYNMRFGGVECCQVQLIWTDSLCCVRVLLKGQCPCRTEERHPLLCARPPARLLSVQAGSCLPQPSSPESWSPPGAG